MNRFIITWNKIEKYGQPIIRKNEIATCQKSDDIGVLAKSALNLLMKSYGNLKNINIIEIQQIDENNNPIGEPIKPQEDTSIVPSGR